MATTYRVSRNIEASFIDQLTTNFDADWSGINTTKSFAKVYEMELPAVCVRCGVTSHDRAQLGDNSTIRTAQVLLDFFCTSDGQKLDLLDYTVGKIKGGLIYYNYEIENGIVKTKTADGRIRIMDIDITHINFEVDRNTLDKHDRFRALITLEVRLSFLEA